MSAGGKLTSLVAPRLLGEVEIDGVLCHHVEARHRRLSRKKEDRLKEEMLAATGDPAPNATHGPTQLWIAVDTLLLRRIEEEVVFDTFVASSVTDYDAEMDVALSEEELAFESPSR